MKKMATLLLIIILKVFYYLVVFFEKIFYFIEIIFKCISLILLVIHAKPPKELKIKSFSEKMKWYILDKMTFCRFEK